VCGRSVEGEGIELMVIMLQVRVAGARCGCVLSVLRVCDMCVAGVWDVCCGCVGGGCVS